MAAAAVTSWSGRYKYSIRQNHPTNTLSSVSQLVEQSGCMGGIARSVNEFVRKHYCIKEDFRGATDSSKAGGADLHLASEVPRSLLPFMRLQRLGNTAQLTLHTAWLYLTNEDSGALLCRDRSCSTRDSQQLKPTSQHHGSSLKPCLQG